MSWRDEELTKLVQPRRRQGVTAVPIDRDLWAVYDDGSGPHGPWRAVAVLVESSEETVGGAVQSTERQLRSGTRVRDTHPHFEVDPRHSALEYASVRFLIIPDDAGEHEDLLVEQGHAFFTLAAANEAHRTRTVAAAERAERLAQRAAEDPG